MSDPIWNVLYCGNWGLGWAGLKALVETPSVRLCKVLTKYDESSSDGYLNSVYELARTYGVPVLNTRRDVCPGKVVTDEIVTCQGLDFIVVCCFDRILTERALQSACHAAINLHPSVLPAYRGVKPLENAIVHGERCTGATLHVMTAGIDEGDILLQDASLEIRPDDTYGQLNQRQCELAGELIRKFFIKPLEFLSSRTPQDERAVTEAPRLPIPIHHTDTVAAIRERHREFQSNARSV
ncbi:MAG: formyltransferase family protein [Verrucomicrobiota bacterium]